MILQIKQNLCHRSAATTHLYLGLKVCVFLLEVIQPLCRCRFSRRNTFCQIDCNGVLVEQSFDLINQAFQFARTCIARTCGQLCSGLTQDGSNPGRQFIRFFALAYGPPGLQFGNPCCTVFFLTFQEFLLRRCQLLTLILALQFHREHLVFGNHRCLLSFDEVETLLNEYTVAVDLAKRVSAAETAATQRLNYLEQEYTHLQTQIEMRGGGRAMAQVLFDLQDQLLNPDESRVDNTDDLPKLDDLRIRNLKVEREIRGHDKLVSATGGDSLPLAKTLLDARRELFEKLNQEYIDLLPTLSALSVANELYLQQTSNGLGHKEMEQSRREFLPMVSIKQPGDTFWNIADGRSADWHRTANPEQLLRNIPSHLVDAFQIQFISHTQGRQGGQQIDVLLIQFLK